MPDSNAQTDPGWPGRPLSPVEIEAYDVLSPDLARRVRIVRVPYLPGGYAGMTLGRSVLLSRPVNQDGTSALLAHELVHVRQWAEQGRIGFSRRYLMSFLVGLWKHRSWGRAYRSIQAEIEARELTSDWLRRMTARRAREEGGSPPDTGGPVG